MTKHSTPTMLWYRNSEKQKMVVIKNTDGSEAHRLMKSKRTLHEQIQKVTARLEQLNLEKSLHAEYIETYPPTVITDKSAIEVLDEDDIDTELGLD